MKCFDACYGLTFIEFYQSFNLYGSTSIHITATKPYD